MPASLLGRVSQLTLSFALSRLRCCQSQRLHRSVCITPSLSAEAGENRVPAGESREESWLCLPGNQGHRGVWRESEHRMGKGRDRKQAPLIQAKQALPLESAIVLHRAWRNSGVGYKLFKIRITLYRS